jgi:hypothetical protein
MLMPTQSTSEQANITHDPFSAAAFFTESTAASSDDPFNAPISIWLNFPQQTEEHGYRCQESAGDFTSLVDQASL